MTHTTLEQLQKLADLIGAGVHTTDGKTFTVTHQSLGHIMFVGGVSDVRQFIEDRKEIILQ